MKSNPKKKKSVFELPKEEGILLEVARHYQMWTEDNDTRRTRKNGWNDITDAYWGKLPADWPFINKVVDPRIRTSIIEKDARLINQKLRGRLVPREGGDVLKARLNNALLDFQWDNANHGGSMLEKLKITSQDTRLYATKFVLVPWLYECNEEGDVVFNGNEYIPLDLRDCGLDPNCNNIRDAKWFQYSAWKTMEELERQNDAAMTTEDKDAKSVYPGLAELKTKIVNNQSDRRDTRYENRILGLKGLDDRMGDDKSFPVIEVVTEFRRDRWITFCPRYKVILRDIQNPYAHGKIPVAQLRYYSIQGDPMGESEVEPVLPLWKAIQANLCGFLDNMMIHIRPPLKILDGRARIETIVYGPEAQWIVDQVDAVTEHRSNGEALQNFQTTQQSLLSAFNTAMGDTSMGISAYDPNDNKKTATEIKRSAQQQLTRDQLNQVSLSEFLQDVMSMWLSNNKQFLFSDPEMKEYILRIVGSDLFNYFQRAGLDELEVPDGAMQAISDIVQMEGGNMSDDDILTLMDSAKVPKYPVFNNPNEKDPEKLEYKPKMRINELGDGAEISLVPEDLDGNYDYIPDIKSMATGAGDQLVEARQKAIERVTLPPVLQLLTQQGVRPNMKELLISDFEDSGLRDAERFFETMNQDQMMQPGQVPGQPGVPQPDMNQILQAGQQPMDPSMIQPPQQLQTSPMV